MTQGIRKKQNSFFTQFLIAKMTISSILKTSAILIIYFLNLKLYNVEIATTMAFLTLILLEMIFAYSCRNLKVNVINKNILNNKYMNKSIIILSIIQIIVFTTPIRNIFNITNLNLSQFLICLLVVIIVFLIDEFSKNTIKKIFKD